MFCVAFTTYDEQQNEMEKERKKEKILCSMCKRMWTSLKSQQPAHIKDSTEKKIGREKLFLFGVRVYDDEWVNVNVFPYDTANRPNYYTTLRKLDNSQRPKMANGNFRCRTYIFIQLRVALTFFQNACSTSWFHLRVLRLVRDARILTVMSHGRGLGQMHYYQFQLKLIWFLLKTIKKKPRASEPLLSMCSVRLARKYVEKFV